VVLGVQKDGRFNKFAAIAWEKVYPSEKLQLPELALVEPLVVSFHAVARARITSDDIVAVFGCGMIGLGVVAGAADRQATVIGIDVDDAKLAKARQVGAKDTINSARENLHARLQEMSGGHGPSVVVEAVGLPQTYQSAVAEVAFAGRVVYIGWAKEKVQYDTKPFVLKELDILGSRTGTDSDFQEVIRFLESGRLSSETIITRTVPFEDAGAALQGWNADPGAITKIQVEIE
jgi:threonine dehydrogenase-like Zn-dependent dehydrogenase